MKKIIITSCLAFFAIIGCKNGKNEVVQNAAKDTANFTTIHWIDSIVSFGKVNFGEKIDIKFRCKNTGNKPLIIANARPGCGCTVADFTKEPIAPDNEGIVTASFDSKKGHSVEVRKTIMVTTNTSNQTEHYLIFTGEVKGTPDNDKVMVPHPVPDEKKH